MSKKKTKRKIRLTPSKRKSPRKANSPKVLLIDIESRPILAHVWGCWDQNVSLNMIEADWSILSFAAKWLGDPPSKIIYCDVSKQPDIENDRPVLEAAWKLLDQADIVITQNGVAFDRKKLNARFIIQGMKPPSPFRMIDTKLIAKRNFGFTSNRLEYLSDKLNKKYKKLKHEKFNGFELWRECLAGNKEAWAEMRKYNMYDVLALEELYHKLAPWDSKSQVATYTDDHIAKCSCGSTEFKRSGWQFTATGKFQRYCCKECGAWSRGRINHFSEATKRKLRVGISQGGSQ